MFGYTLVQEVLSLSLRRFGTLLHIKRRDGGVCGCIGPCQQSMALPGQKLPPPPCLTTDPRSDRIFRSDPWSDRDFGGR